MVQLLLEESVILNKYDVSFWYFSWVGSLNSSLKRMSGSVEVCKSGELFRVLADLQQNMEKRHPIDWDSDAKLLHRIVGLEHDHSTREELFLPLYVPSLIFKLLSNIQGRSSNEF